MAGEHRQWNNWSDLSDLGLYIGSLSPNLTIFTVDRGYDTYMYRVVITGTCGVPVNSDAVELTVETAPEILIQPEAFVACENIPAGFGWWQREPTSPTSGR